MLKANIYVSLSVQFCILKIHTCREYTCTSSWCKEWWMQFPLNVFFFYLHSWDSWHNLNFYVVVHVYALLACENIRFSSLFAAGDISRGGTSATQWQKFHTYDVKSVRNAVRSADWSAEYLHSFTCCLRMTEKRQKATKVKCKREESLTKQSIFVEYSLLQKKHWSFAAAHWQMNTTLYQNRPEDA